MISSKIQRITNETKKIKRNINIIVTEGTITMTQDATISVDTLMTHWTIATTTAVIGGDAMTMEIKIATEAGHVSTADTSVMIVNLRKTQGKRTWAQI